MSRTSHLISISQMSLEEKGLNKNPLKGREYGVMDVMVLVTLELNVLHILRNRRRIYLLLGLKRILRVILKRNLQSMLKH